MYTEELVEEGIVTDIKNGLAVVTVISSDSCEDCSAKLFCHNENKIKSVTATDSYGVKLGDKVRISIRGRNVVTASIILYGLPLFLLVLGIFLGTRTFETHSEVYSAVVGLTLVAVYFFILYFISKSGRAKNRFLPRIVYVSSYKNASKDEIYSKIN